ncbi:DUF5954 family protein [Actinomadura parmotrematis]|uniref:PE-PGRS family protein n=1 Tax=Actinomadura parmotrematis TaxID=2864039 RepID=A0ABS7FTG5_9ACTN|nr:DUF5954 family protein [Actinomadura parmotrematis]MBW8482877.1 hypothetical protein [Actinomadura parmotrematis]
MGFPLMKGFDHIQVAADLDPVAAARDAELGERMRAFSKLFPADKPDFGFAIQTGGEWRIGHVGCNDPQGTGISLAAHLRLSAREEPDPRTAAGLNAVARKLDPEDGRPSGKGEWEIGDRRYRRIRIERVTLIHRDKGMEPPRATDTDPPDEARLLHDHPIDPTAPCGQWDAQLRLNLAGYRPIPGLLPEDVELDARHAVTACPGIVVLPPDFTVVEVLAPGSWKPFTSGEGPGLARDALAGYFTEVLPRLREFQGDPPTPDERERWAGAAAAIRDAPGPDFHADGRHFRTVRVIRFLRLGRDGPEGLRPTDPDQYDWTPE